MDFISNYIFEYKEIMSLVSGVWEGMYEIWDYGWCITEAPGDSLYTFSVEMVWKTILWIENNK